MNTAAVLSTANREADALIEDLGPYHYLHTILEETPNGVVVVGPDHTVIHANPAACNFLGVPYGSISNINRGRFKELLGESNSELFLLIRDHFEQRGGDSGKIHHEVEFTRNGERCILSAVVVFPPTGTEYYLLYLIDVTAQKNLERELRRRNAFFHNLIDSTVDGVIASDMRGSIMIFNQEAKKYLK